MVTRAFQHCGCGCVQERVKKAPVLLTDCCATVGSSGVVVSPVWFYIADGNTCPAVVFKARLRLYRLKPIKSKIWAFATTA